MNEGDSAGGGQQGLNPAPPAVLDRRSILSSSNSSTQIYNQGIQQNQAVTSGSAVSSSINTLSQQQQLQQQHHNQLQHMTSRYLSNERIGNITNQQQQRTVIAQIQSQHQQSNNNINLNINSGGLPRASNNTVSSSYTSNTTRSGNIGYTNTSSGSYQSTSAVASLTTSKPQQNQAQISDNSNLLLLAGRKRLKLETSQTGITATANSGGITPGTNDINALKKRILEHKYLRLKSLKERYSEHVAELFFLQNGGNMMDYPVWRKKPPTPQFINFSKSYRLDGYVNEDVNKSHTTLQTPPTPSTPASLPQGAEIKIPSVGATPIAVSTTLPAAVVQLSQQGGTPLVPDIPSNTSSISEKRKTSNTTTIGSAYAQSPNTANGVQEQFSVKAKQEVYVMQRISELQREGLWTEKRLPKLQEPTRPKAHWDYLLEEMVWLAADFAQERKWKKAAAKKCARMVQKYFNDKANAAQKAEKAQELHLKRVAAFIAKEIKVFWSNVEKLVEFKHQTKLEEKRKKALDQHLSFIVDQTEKFSQQLAEGMNKSVMDTSAVPSLNSSRISSPKRENMSDEEFHPESEASEDDEETIAKAEAEAPDVKEEIAALQRESQMDLDEFLKELPKDYLENREKIVLEDKETVLEDPSGDSEFEANENSSDDEDTIMEQEKTEKNVDHKKELDELNADNEMSLDDLLAKYKRSGPSIENKMEVDSDDDEEPETGDSDEGTEESEEEENSSANGDTVHSNSEEGDSNVGLKSLLVEELKVESEGDNDDLINDAAALAESIQPKGNTLSSTNVVTPVPFLLKHSLREYQHIGLDWLVTMHDRKLNGILADEMGLGKTIQTIALLAHLACVKGNWGPHLIVVPSSVMLNWEMEFKKWCPGFKILTYYGTQKERKQKRIGWTKPNAFHVCITSYKLVIQDQQSFRRKKWKYLILDEAQNIKNFKSQRWQLLLNFQTEQRLLLTGTPLQNNLMELWSLMHFLMPHVFQSHREFKEWFSNPVTGMIEGNSEYNDSIIKRLHKVLRPFLLRRLKSEVEKQMPKKYEHVVMCRLSKRQRYLYDDFMSRAKTREMLATGHYMSVINVLMQLRKVCNHPNLFEVRPTISPFQMEGINFHTASIVCNILDYNPLMDIDLNSLNLVLIQLELCLTAYVSHKIRKLTAPRKLIEEIDAISEPPPKCPSGKYKFHIRIKDSRVQENIISHSGVKVGTSPAMKTEGNKLVPVINLDKKYSSINQNINKFSLLSTNKSTVLTSTTSGTILKRSSDQFTGTRVAAIGGVTSTGSQVPSPQIAQIVQTTSGRHILLTPASSGTVLTQTGQRITVLGKTTNQGMHTRVVGKSATGNAISGTQSNLVVALAQQIKANSGLPHQRNLEKADSKDSDTKLLCAEREHVKKERRQQVLKFLSYVNQRKCDAIPIYGEDCREAMKNFAKPNRSLDFSTWHSRSHTNCVNAMWRKDNWSLKRLLLSYEERTHQMKAMFQNYVICVPAVSAPQPYLHVSHPHPSKVNVERTREIVMQQELSSKLSLLHPIISATITQFPDPRLIQYDCGKLQTLNLLLRKLKTEGHRVLIFTQMTKMLDVLEAFLNYHGHIYLRLDGTTRIEQRQVLMERFNGDKRIFAFILSTRSGGVGVNLTGADTVIFYDSDWNPTMDAQAQDRCHRIGQTRDVHIYRLLSEKTIEENILKKANQKRLLGDLAIEGGNFTTAFFKSSTIRDLFQVEVGEDASTRLAEVLNRDREKKLRMQENPEPSTSTAPAYNGGEEKTALGAFETALAAAEDEQDVQAAKIAKAEAAAELAEFDENIPLEEADKPQEMSKADQEVANLVKQLSPIERYAMRFVEETGGSWTAEQLRQAEAEIEQQKREWEANRLAALQKEEEIRKVEKENDEMLTYSREDAKNQIWISDNTLEKMPMWCPPTPPQGDNDVYIDYSLSFLYEADIMPESHLPPIYIKKEYKRTRTDAGFYIEGRRPTKIRKEDNYCAPRSLFDRPSPSVAKVRRDLKLQRYRGIFKPNVQIPNIKQQLPVKQLVEPEGMADWCIYEDIAILHVLQNLQGLPLNLMLLSPGHTPNWDLVAEVVNLFSRTYRSPKQCRWRYEAKIVPFEEGKLLESPKKQKKLKTSMKASAIKGGVKSLRTSQLFTADNNSSFTKLMKLKYDNIKAAYLKKAPPPKQVFGVATQKNLKHIAALNDFGITNYDSVLSPSEIALRKAEKYKEKQRSAMTLPPPAQQPQEVGQQVVKQQQTQPQQQQQIPVQQQQTAIVVQQSPQVATAVQQQGIQQVTQIMQTNPMQSRATSQGGNIAVHQQTQIVKAIVTPSSGIVTGQVQHITQPTSQQVQLQQQAAMQQSGNMVNQPSVSVVLTTPVSTISTVQQTSQPTQIVSLQQQSITSSSPLVSQAQNTSIVQTISSQSLPQVVSVSQLATVGTVLTTSATLQPNATVATLNTNTLRTQRLVAAAGTLQEVVLQQRPNSQSPTIVSMSGLAQGVTQTQFQAAQLRLSMAGAQQVSSVVAKGISVGSLQQAGKITTNQSAQIQLYRQQALRQQLKVLQTSGAQGGGAAAVVQTAGGQTALVNASGTIIQGGIVPTGQTVQVQGQKVSVATVSAANVAAGSSGVVTSVATVQVAPGQTRTQFIKQVGVGGKQTITRQVTDSEMLLVKRQLISQPKTQVIPQTQIFAPANVQVQQAGPSGQPPIATLVKTSSGTVTATGGTVGMALSQIKPGGQIKVTMANQNQVRQLQLQQQLALAQQRKVGKMTQIAQVAGKTGVPTQLIVQNPKNLPGSVTVQQIQQVIRHAQPGTLAATGQIVLGKTSVGRVIPVSVSSQPNARQTIQVVSASSAQALAAGNIRAHVAGAQNIAGTIKVAAGATQVQTQQALITALQSQQNQRQNASPVRLQTTSGGSLVAVTVQQPSATAVSSNTATTEVTSMGQQTSQQQVRNLVKKKIMSIRSEKE